MPFQVFSYFSYISSKVNLKTTILVSKIVDFYISVGCPSNSINPLDPVNVNAIEERPIQVARIEDDTSTILSVDESIA